MAATGVVLFAGMVPAQADAAPAPGGGADKATGRAVTGSAAAALTPGGKERADYDSRRTITPPSQSASAFAAGPAGVPRNAAAVRKLQEQLGLQGIVDIDATTGTPRRVARVDGFLTGPSRKRPATIALDYVRTHAAVFGLDADAFARLTLRKEYKDIEGTRHLSFVQTVDGVPVFGNGLKAHVARDGRLIQVDGSPVIPRGEPTVGNPAMTAAKARASAVADVFGDSKAAVAKAAVGPTRTTTFTDGGNAQLVMFQTTEGLELAWQVVLLDEGYLAVLDATRGRVLYRQNLVHHDSAQVWDNFPAAHRGGTAKRRDLSRWLPKQATTLSGNIAHVYSDVDGNDAVSPGEEIIPRTPGNFEAPFVDFSSQVGAPCSASFPCSWNPSVPFSWKTNRAQNAAQMYYFLGTWHDHLASKPIGFTRAAGNFEGVDGDAVRGEALDGADTAGGLPDGEHVDNANMTMPPDGTPPVMQMYLFRAPGNPSDPFLAGNSGDSADIIYHEYTHGLSGRLVVDAGGTATIGSSQGGAMGEAWSDWYAMDYLVAKGLETDTRTVGDIGIGDYVEHGGRGVLRSEPMDCPVGTRAAACPGSPFAGAGGYTYGDFGRIAGGPEVHADGEIWGQTLWDLRVEIGSKKAESLVTRAMELSPADPSFIDMRNSILMADLVVNKGKLQKSIWKVFAARGMGFFAAATGGADVQPFEDFSLPPAPNTPRSSLTGTVLDSRTGTPAVGVVVAFDGHASGFAGSYVAATDAKGRYTITGIAPGRYAKVSAGGAGFDTQVRTVTVKAAPSSADFSLRRDWAGTGGNSSVTDFNGPDFGADFGCGPVHLFDQSQGSGWGSTIELDADGKVVPRFVTVRLPRPVDISEIAVNPTGTCGDEETASTGDFRLETSTDGTTWVLAAEGHFGVADRVMHPVPLSGGTTAVRFVRYTMLSSQVADSGGACPGPFSGCDFVDSTELSVYGDAR